MNFSDSEIVVSVLEDKGYEVTQDALEADLIFVNTCSIRDNAEKRVWGRLRELKSLKRNNPNLKIGVLGCMAERLKQKLLDEEKAVDIIAGPDVYRNLPELITTADHGQKAINVILSTDETYAELNPVRYDSNNVTAFISIMRGCENYCAYCVVPFTRGKERSRDPLSILSEARKLFEDGFREVTLLGQNVNSYKWNEKGKQIKFYQLIEMVAQVDPLLRVRFATSHPKDLSDDLLKTISKHVNICNSIHLPVQSGSDQILKLMNRKYTGDWYKDRISNIRSIIPDCTISTDVISGFCNESDKDHNDTLSLMEWAKFDYAFMFKYSERPGTMAAKKLVDNVPDKIKSNRLLEIIELQRSLSLKSNEKDVGKTFEVLIEGTSKKSQNHLSGRNSQNKVVVFPGKNYNPGDYVKVRVNSCTTATLLGEIM